MKKQTQKKIFLVSLFFSLTAFIFAQAKPTSDPRLLHKKMIIITTLKNPASNLPGVHLEMVVEAPRELIWYIMTNNSLGKDVFDYYEGMDILEHDDEHELIEYDIKILFKRLNYTILWMFDKEQQRIQWINTAGDLKHVSGFWEIQETVEPDKFLLIYETFVDIGFYTPGWVTKMVQNIESKRMASTLRNWMEKLAAESVYLSLSESEIFFSNLHKSDPNYKVTANLLQIYQLYNTL